MLANQIVAAPETAQVPDSFSRVEHGLLFAVVVILLFLLSLRSTLVTAIPIPLSVLAKLNGLYVTN